MGGEGPERMLRARERRTLVDRHVDFNAQRRAEQRAARLTGSSRSLAQSLQALAEPVVISSQLLETARPRRLHTRYGSP